jgi:hypothetical protein
LFPRVTTWVGVPRHRVFRRYMQDFVSLFAPHWPVDLIAQAATAESQEEVDRIAAGVELPLRNGCTEGLAEAA